MPGDWRASWVTFDKGPSAVGSALFVAPGVIWIWSSSVLPQADCRTLV
jgi:hypothetical protein